MRPLGVHQWWTANRSSTARGLAHAGHCSRKYLQGNLPGRGGWSKIPRVTTPRAAALANYTPNFASNPKTPLAKRRDPDSTERMIRPGFLDIEIAAKPDRVGSGRVGR